MGHCVGCPEHPGPAGVLRRRYAEDEAAATLARRVVAFYAAWPVVETTAQLIVSASLLHERHGFAFWDAMVVEAALLSGATTLLTEDLQDGRRIGGLTISNPFG